MASRPPADSGQASSPVAPEVAPQVQIPATHSSPVPHALPQTPQFSSSSCRLTQPIVGQQVSVAAHSAPPPAAFHSQLQLPPTQAFDVCVLQRFRQPPQFVKSVA